MLRGRPKGSCDLISVDDGVGSSFASHSVSHSPRVILRPWASQTWRRWDQAPSGIRRSSRATRPKPSSSVAAEVSTVPSGAFHSIDTLPGLEPVALV
jgi:hypothetical protein